MRIHGVTLQRNQRLAGRVIDEIERRCLRLAQQIEHNGLTANCEKSHHSEACYLSVCDEDGRSLEVRIASHSARFGGSMPDIDIDITQYTCWNDLKRDAMQKIQTHFGKAQ